MSPPGTASAVASITPDLTATAGTGVAGVPVSAAVENNKNIIKLLKGRNEQYKDDKSNLIKKYQAKTLSKETRLRYAGKLRHINSQIRINNRYIAQLNTQIKYLQNNFDIIIFCYKCTISAFICTIILFISSVIY